jgi:hypothetical protein
VFEKHDCIRRRHKQGTTQHAEGPLAVTTNIPFLYYYILCVCTEIPIFKLIKFYDTQNHYSTHRFLSFHHACVCVCRPSKDINSVRANLYTWIVLLTWIITTRTLKHNQTFEGDVTFLCALVKRGVGYDVVRACVCVCMCGQILSASLCFLSVYNIFLKCVWKRKCVGAHGVCTTCISIL